MHFPVSIQIGRFALHAHTILEVLSYFVGFRIYMLLRKRRGDVIDDAHRWSVVAAAAVGAAVGSKLLYWLEEPAITLIHRTDLAYLLGGKTIVGGLIGGWLAVEFVKRLEGVTVATGDLFTVPLAIGIAIGRIGCFLEGLPDHTYGSPTNMPWGVDFGDGIRRHPTQLYELIFVIALAALLWKFISRPHVNGYGFKFFMLSYMSWRFFVGVLQPDPAIFLGLQALQWAALAVTVYYIWFFSARTPSYARTVRGKLS